MPADTLSDSKKIIEFSGLKWYVAHSTIPMAPGPNFWSDENVWVDEAGRLHLKLTKDSVTGLWQCAELASAESFGAGQYSFFVEGRIDRMDKNIVFGMFQYSGDDLYDEIDIEYAEWGKEHGSNLTCSVHPKKGIRESKWNAAARIDLEGTYTTNRFTRNNASINFQGLHGFRTDDSLLFYSATCHREKIITLRQMPVYLNLWLFRGQPPSDGKEVELVIHKFSFTPAS